jgi:hypothetical protein
LPVISTNVSHLRWVVALLLFPGVCVWNMTGSDVIRRPERAPAPARDAPLCVNCRYIFDRWYRRRRQFFHTWHISKFHCTPYQLLNNARTCPSCYLLLTKNQESVVKLMENDSDPIGYYEVNNHGHGDHDLTQVVALRFKTSSDSNVLCLMYSVDGAPSQGKCPHDQTNFFCSST